MKNMHFLTRQAALRIRRVTTILAVLAMVFAFLPPPSANALAMAQIRWVQTRIKAATLSDVQLQFTIPTGVDASTDTITLTFDTGYDLGTFVLTDYDFEVGDSGTCSTAAFTDETLAASPAAGVWGIATTGAPKRIVTLTAPTDATTGEVTAGRCVQLLIGSNAGGGSTVVTNPSTGNYDVDITSELGAVDDSGSGSIAIITDEQVTVSATVDPSITFVVSSGASVSFGTLLTGTGRWATSGGGANASATTPDAGTVFQVATNAPTGWALTYNGATLTIPSAAPTIDVATIVGDSDGTQNTEQFALTASTDGNSTIASGYLRDATSDLKFVAGSAQTLVSEAIATNTENITVSYLANIGGATEAGAYSTTLTFIASATF